MSEKAHKERTEIIQTDDGPITGFVNGGMRQFLGIPYASPPVGSLRWRPPTAPVSWSDPREAVTFGNVCAQNANALPGLSHDSWTEDCLYLNVFTPARVGAGKMLPVMVLIPGGGFFCGGSNDYDPISLVTDGNVVFVSFNYRLNVFGFFSHPAINTEAHLGGNYGIMDQQCALTWVQHNIEEFGGDAGNVTLVGESAGGLSVMSHILSPRSTGLFHKAIVQSGGSLPTMPQPTIESLEKVGVALASATGCLEQNPTCLRSISTEELVKANAIPHGTFGPGRYHFGLMEDGIVIPHSPKELFRAGKFNRVPLIAGVNKDEFSWFQALKEMSTGKVLSAETYPEDLAAAFDTAGEFRVRVPSSKISQILDRYPLTVYSSPSRAVAAAIGDAGIISVAGRRSHRVIKQWVRDLYAYEFDVPDAPVAWPEVSFPYGSAHTQELQFIFPMFHGNSGKAHPLTKQQQNLAKQMVCYWTSFARHGTPNMGNPANLAFPCWQIYEAERDNVLLLQAPNSCMIDKWGRGHHCDFWDSFYS